MTNIRIATLSDVKGIAKIYVDTWQETYKGIVKQQFLDGLSYQAHEYLWSDYLIGDTITYVAEDEYHEIIGFATAAELNDATYKTYQTELLAIYLKKDAQGQSIGQQLVKAIARYYINQNINSMIVRILEENPYKQFYESLKALRVGREDVTIGTQHHTELVYGWQKLYKVIEL